MPVRPAGAPEPGSAPKLVASVPWVLVLLGVVTLAVLLLVASLSFRVREPEPAAASAPPLVPPVSPAATASASVSPTPRASRSRTEVHPSRSVRPSPTVTSSSRTPSAPRSNQPASVDGGALTATYRVRDADRDDVAAELVLRNGTGHAEQWRVDLAFSGRVRNLRVFGAPVWVVPRGDGRYVLRGLGPLAQGRSVELTLRFSRDDRDDQLSGCRVNGGDCALD
ncbi:hypothetical protein [Micromonospora sp. 15K316]|uniref:hypothetical protein n=1 Tax=Micromonospora sp. 15K316 TaxID=2530376 RepID=UPI001404AB48|nr:hypothetical protein [Micromonospora sp. 15K316]